MLVNTKSLSYPKMQYFLGTAIKIQQVVDSKKSSLSKNIKSLLCAMNKPANVKNESEKSNKNIERVELGF